MDSIEMPPPSKTCPFDLTAYFNDGKEELYLGEFKNRRAANKAAEARCRDVTVQSVKITRWGQFVDCYSGEAVRSNMARAERMKARENDMA